MKPIVVIPSRGANKAIDARALPEGVAAQVIDCEPERSDMRPLKVRATVATVPASPQRKSIWRMGHDTVSAANYWLQSSNVVNWALLFGSDSTEMTAYTGDGTPRWTNNVIGLGGGAPYPQAFRELAVPAPVGQATRVLTTDGPSGTASTRYYVYTFVNDLGWESAPSPATTGLTCKPGAVVDLSNLDSAPAGAYGITKRRIYRTNPDDTTTNQSDFFYLGEVVIGTTTFQDNALAIGSPLETFDGSVGSSWLTPPADGFGIAALWNGIYSILSGRYVYFSEAGAAYAYPLRNRKTLRDTAVAQAVWPLSDGTYGCIVLTTGRAVLFQGSDPRSMQDSPMSTSWPCRSARGVVAFDFGVVWPSNQGLASSWSKTLLTDGVFTEDQWKALNPDTMVAGRWGKYYVCAYNDGASKGFIFDPMNPAGSLVDLSAGFDACYYDALADALFVLEGANVRQFAAGPGLLAGTYTAKRFLQTEPNDYGYAQVMASAYPVTLTVRARATNPNTGAEVLRTETRTVSNANPFGLKSGGLFDDWQPEVSSSAGHVQVVRLARTMDDLKGG